MDKLPPHVSMIVGSEENVQTKKQKCEVYDDVVTKVESFKTEEVWDKTKTNGEKEVDYRETHVAHDVGRFNGYKAPVNISEEEPLPVKFVIGLSSPVMQMLSGRPKIISQRKKESRHFSLRSAESFHFISKIREGVHSQLYKARDKETGKLVALKTGHLGNGKNGFPSTTVNEIRMLKMLHHQNIINLRGMAIDEQSGTDFEKSTLSFFPVFEYMDSNLMTLLEMGINLSDEQMALIMKQVIAGLCFCHRNNVIHRNIKCSNILLNKDGQVKLSGFGSAHLYLRDSKRPPANRVVPLLYRSPELLLGQVLDGPPTDIWSCGCILGEMFKKAPLFQKHMEIPQLVVISKLCGSPVPSIWPEVVELPLWSLLQPSVIYYRRLREDFAFLTKPALDLLDQMLTLDPKKRISAEDALESPWLKNIEPERN